MRLPGAPRPRTPPAGPPRPRAPRREPLSSPPVPRGLVSRSLTSSDSEALDNSELVPATWSQGHVRRKVDWGGETWGILQSQEAIAVVTERIAVLNTNSSKSIYLPRLTALISKLSRSI